MGGLYGRATAIERADAHVRGACAGDGALVLLTGEPGIGKSRLAEHLADLAAAEGAKVVWGRCWEAGGAPAYWPWIQVFRALGMDEDPFAVAPDLGGTPEQARFQVFDLAVRRLDEQAARVPIAVVLDDLHAADLPSLFLLLFLARELRRSRILVVGTSRDAEARMVPETATLLARIAREGEVLALGRLDAEDVESWTREALPSATREQAEAIYRATEGHPLFVSEMLRLGPQDTAKNRLLDNLGALLDERMLALSDKTRAALEMASVLGREFSVAELAAVSEEAEDEIERRLREARAAAVVTVGPSAGTFLFSHVLRRDRIYAELLPSRRAALHWKVGTGRLVRGDDPSAAIHHLLEGHSAGDVERAAEVALAVAEAAHAHYAFEEAARLARGALHLLLPVPRPTRTACQLRLVLAEALARMGQWREGKEAALLAAQSARQLGAADLLGRAALAYGTEQTFGHVEAPMVSLLREALAALEPTDSSIRARLTARLSSALMPPKGEDDFLQNRALGCEATAMARRIGDRHTLLYVLHTALKATGLVTPNDERAALLEEIIELARLLGQRLVLVTTLGSYASALIGNGKRAQADLAISDLEGLLAGLPQSQDHWRGPIARALLAGLDDDFVEADRLNETANALARQAGSSYGIVLSTLQRFTLAHLRGDPSWLTKVAGAMVGAQSSLPTPMVMTAVLAAAGGRKDAVLGGLRSATWNPGDVMSAVFGALACITVEDVETAERLYAPLTQVAHAHRLFWGPALAWVVGPVSRLVGELALLAGRPAEALRHHDEALAVCGLTGSPALETLCRRSHANALARCAAAPGALTPGPRATATSPPRASPRIELRREGDVWALAEVGRPAIRLKHSKGLGYLNYLLEQPGRETHVLELLGTEHVAGDAGPMLDARAKAEYRQRLDDLRDELEEGERFGDLGRVARAQSQIEAIAEQLAGAVGLGGRDRRAASDVERARVNVQRRLKDTLDRIAAADATLGRYLNTMIKTGTYCSYNPV